MRLIVLAGAKEGTVIPLKKDEFTIGRSKECTLRAGSEAISRRHCVIKRKDSAWIVRDMGSRNGTFVNDQRIEGKTVLADGDELRVGPLHFRVSLAEAEKPAESKPAAATKPSKAAEAALKAAQGNDDSSIEDDISRWLLGPADGAQSLKETRTLTMADTKALEKKDAVDNSQTAPAASEAPENGEVVDEVVDEVEAEEADEQADPDDSAVKKKGWSLFNKGKDKAKPGKLPNRPDDQKSKDSREAAAEILREMTRRR